MNIQPKERLQSYYIHVGCHLYQETENSRSQRHIPSHQLIFPKGIHDPDFLHQVSFACFELFCLNSFAQHYI